MHQQRFSYSDSFDVSFHSRLEEMVSTDPLTGMSSKRQYDAIYEALHATTNPGSVSSLVLGA